MAQAYNNSGAGSGYGDQPEWPTSTAMARNTSHESDYSNSSEFSNGQYDVALSPSSEGLSNYDFLSTPDGGTYAGDDLSYEMNSPAGESGFQYQFYNFIASGDSGQAPYWQLKPNYTPTTDYPAMIPVEPTPEV